MSDNDPPVAADDFPEFAEPPRHKPGPEHPARAGEDAESEESEAQAEADAIVARLRQKRSEGGS